MVLYNSKLYFKSNRVFIEYRSANEPNLLEKRSRIPLKILNLVYSTDKITTVGR